MSTSLLRSLPPTTPLTKKIKANPSVITFDLDDTIWQTMPVIKHANSILSDHLLLDKPDSEEIPIFTIMSALFKQSPHLYSGVTLPGAKLSPIMLTALRTDALHALYKSRGHSDVTAKTLSAKAFEIWFNARHDAIPSYFANNLISTLTHLRALKNKHGRPVIIGAITNGNGDPRHVPMLRKYFDFCVNSEKVGVAKPHVDVYHHAISEATRFTADNIHVYEEVLPSEIGEWWAHVGDDYEKDVVPAAELGMRSVWCKEFGNVVDRGDESTHVGGGGGGDGGNVGGATSICECEVVYDFGELVDCFAVDSSLDEKVKEVTV